MAVGGRGVSTLLLDEKTLNLPECCLVLFQMYLIERLPRYGIAHPDDGRPHPRTRLGRPEHILR